ncbi:endo-1,4-beta-xylanase 2-like [Oryza brachyantha]|uniref:endo-1,4-beta-xylanase 2-like n=1 Tax=Oryza brachyantha TaxID=4533 RepID=UPI001ADAA35E|nr:endo-1,4-beta-xylanase 2-like [Oryza brachyantha]
MALAHDQFAFGVDLIEVEHGLAGWSPVGARTAVSAHVERERDDAAVLLPAVATEGQSERRRPRPSGPYVVAARRAGEEDGMRHALPAGALVPRVTYRVVGWVGVVQVQVQVRVEGGGGGAAGGQQHAAAVRVGLRVDDDDGCGRWIDCGAVSAAGGWAEINGAFRLRTRPLAAAVHVCGAPAGVDVKVMDLQVFATDRKARFRQLKEETDKVRKREVVLKFGGGTGTTMSGASVRVAQLENRFPFGSCINKTAIQNPRFVDFFCDNFDWAVFENELKWYSTEPQRGRLDYRDADELVGFCERHGKPARGHCIFWAVDGDVQQWVKDLGRDDLASAVHGRLNGLLSRYAGRFRHYDVNNEMLHGRFYRDRLGDGVAALMFREAARLDPAARLFVNDYNVLRGNDPNATPEKYVELVDALRRGGAVVGGIGVQGHMDNPAVGEVIRAALDKLATAGAPIWVTELDVSEPDVSLRADDLEVVLREAYAHPAVEGVMLWGFMQGLMWRQDAYLVDADGAINEAGRRFLQLRREWRSDARGTLDVDGHFRFRGYHGTYVAQVTTATGKMLRTFTVDERDSSLELDLDMEI